MASYEALYGRKCQTPLCWTELSESKIHGVDLIREIEEKVKLRINRNRADLKRKDIKFQIGDKYHRGKKILWFGRKGKLSPRFIGPYEITKRVGPVAYQLSLPSKLEKIHNVFHVSIL
ncbi:Retrotransposon gag protein [Gossypium australe]|uniref:Retrotransposon gag protein n=1 Tax=Gossypium australe TaxID=47621 RepID=A0A5B6VTS8_9ROSI|nr:Retrotransposon gag protein [Gossypium australe]